MGVRLSDSVLSAHGAKLRRGAAGSTRGRMRSPSNWMDTAELDAVRERRGTMLLHSLFKLLLAEGKIKEVAVGPCAGSSKNSADAGGETLS